MLVEELLVAVEAAAHSDIVRRASGEAHRLVHGHHAGGRQDAADSSPGTQALHEQPARDKRHKAGSEQEAGGHGPMIAGWSA